MPKTSKEKREYQRNYYHKNKEREKRRQKKYREEHPDYFKNWYEENRRWKILVEKLRYVCRPDKFYKEHYESYYPGLDASDVEFDDDLAEECDRVFNLMLRKLRKKCGRDPETGRKINGNSD